MSNMEESTSENETEDNEFYFESDHIALRTTKDYRALLKYVVTLETLKTKTIKDLENLYALKKNAINDPLLFINDLKCGSIKLPSSCTIPEVPVINWSQYGMSNKIEKPETEHENSNVLIRGRAFDQSKPQTFNQLWTCEEQKRLEELLQEFPEEEVEMRRWSKIASALGNRTPKQVMSRVQKYFLKLQRAGLPIPGRTRGPSLPKTSDSRRQQQLNKILMRKSTFFPAQNVPVLMDESQDESEENILCKNPLKWTSLELMHAVYERKKMEEMSNAPLPIHKGTYCCCCKSQIVGTKWTAGFHIFWCTDCLIELQPSTRMTPL